jgi:hypothetical protein
VSTEDVLYQSPLMYRILREPSGSLVIEVVVGGMAMYSVRVRLDDREAETYAHDVTRYSDRLAKEIMADPKFGGRAYEAPSP